jgi:hypothetical protein
LVYWGPGESGKTTNFFKLKETYPERKISQGFSIATTDERTLWQDSLFLKFNFHYTKPYELIIQIVTCTGQERFLSTREFVVQGADGVIFVADSDQERMESNMRSYQELIAFSKENKTPILIQLNKRDVKNAVPLEVFKNTLRLPRAETDHFGHRIVYEVIAKKGIGVVEVFNDMIERILFEHFSHHK